MSYPPPPPSPYGYGYPPPPPPDHPQATTILVLGLVSLFCGLAGPFAWVMGRRVLAEIDASGGNYGGRTNVQVGYIIGICTSVLMLASVLFLIAYMIILAVVFGASGAAST